MFEQIEMSKPTITRLFVVAIAFVVAGSVGGTAVVIGGLANGAVAFGGSQLITLDPGPLAGTVVGLVVASLLTAIGTLAAVASWAAALLNTYRLEDKTWFVGLLVLGLVSLGWLAMIAYVVKGPDGATGAAPSVGQ